MIENLDELKTEINRKDPMEILRIIGHPNSSPRTNGNEIRDNCPFHGGDSGSLSVNAASGVFFCHNAGCGKKGGDNIALYQAAKGLDFISAIRELAGKFGIHVIDNNATTPKPIVAPIAVSIEKRNPPPQENKLLQSRKTAANIWSNASVVGEHQYFADKGIEPVSGVRFGNDERGNAAIVVPLYDVDGVLQAIQFVSGHGKFFAKGTTPSGAFFNLGCRAAGSPSVYFCEGMATAISVWGSEKGPLQRLSCKLRRTYRKSSMLFQRNTPKLK